VDAKVGRTNQRRRTRKALLEAASRLMADGGTPSFEDIAESALVSRATAYRYFPGLEALLLEASLDLSTPKPEELFGPGAAADPLERIEQVDAAFQRMMEANEPALRTMLAHALERKAQGKDEADVPARQNRRSPLIEAALAPAAEEFDPQELDLLKKALALVIGSEAMIVFKDVLQLDAAEAARVRGWTIRTLVEAARRR
jgi:AcrR family transcriptional regulator